MNTNRDHLRMATARMKKLDEGDPNYTHAEVQALATIALAERLDRIADLFEAYLQAEQSARAGMTPAADVIEAWNVYSLARQLGTGNGHQEAGR